LQGVNFEKVQYTYEKKARGDIMLHKVVYILLKDIEESIQELLCLKK